MVQTKFECFLKMFAAVKGPQQLLKHQMLLKMFIGFLSNSDPKTANLAFMCVGKFKLPYLVPYMDAVQPMLKKDGLRESLAKFDLSVDSDSVDAEHRLLLIPIITRILFGRLSSRSAGTKSSKDSPAGRRAAILSFFSRMGNAQEELTYFVYMMTRAFIVPGHLNYQLNTQSGSLASAIKSLNSITKEEIALVSTQRQVGFLNLLSDVISQIGFGVVTAVPVFTNMLLTMSEESQEVFIANATRQALKSEETHDDDESSTQNNDNQAGRIRTLTFLRLGDLLCKFASAIDFSTYGGRLWKAMSQSLRALPSTVINAENPPSLLRLIENISSHPKLLPLINDSNDVIPAIFRCIAGTTRMKVMNSVLHIIDNLLTEGGTGGSAQAFGQTHHGESLILGHIHLLIAQLNERIMSKISKCDEEADIKEYIEKGQTVSSSEGLQLDILCRVSELLLNDESSCDEHSKTMENLCSLLVPSLKFDTRPNQLHLLKTVANFIPRLSFNAAKTHYHALSKVRVLRSNEINQYNHCTN